MARRVQTFGLAGVLALVAVLSWGPSWDRPLAAGELKVGAIRWEPWPAVAEGQEEICFREWADTNLAGIYAGTVGIGCVGRVSLGWAGETGKLYVVESRAGFYEQFPPGSIELDSALVMRGLPHEWHALPEVPDLGMAQLIYDEVNR